MRKRTLFLILILICAGAGLAYSILTVEYFAIKHINITGNQIVKIETINKVSQNLLNKNIFRFSKKELKEFKKKVHQINDLIIKRKYPDRINIQVIEKEPWINLAITKQNYILDKTGYILNTEGVNPIDSTTLPVIKIKENSIITNNRVDLGLLDTISKILLPLSALLEAKELQINLLNASDIEIIANELLVIKIGSINNIKEKQVVLKTFLLLIQDNWENVNYIDIKSAKNPVINYKEEPK